ncbi:MAG: DUF4270 family protein [Prolixibacteraceae bacterium]|nr:DUF4270 family protein [Prolixibacteraceae bacterium]
MMKIKYLILIVTALIFSSCEFTDSPFKYNVGNDFIENNVRVIMIDTLTVKTYTTAIDSIATSQTQRILAGRFKNKYGMITYCESYFRLDPSGSQFFDETSVFDSACFILNVDGYNMGDTTKLCQFEIYRLTEEIDVDEETEMIYNTRQYKHENQPLATFSLDLSDDDVDSVCIRLSDVFGKTLYDMAYNEDEDQDGNIILDDAEAFKEIYKGFVIKPLKDNVSCVVGFNADPDSSLCPRLRVYYHDNSMDDDMSFEFSLEKNTMSASNTNNYYSSNYIKNDYSEFVIKDIPTDEEMTSSEQTNNLTFLQGGTNLRTRIEIPYINNLYHLGIGSIIKAEICFRPVNGSFENRTDLPDSLEIYVVDDINRSFGQLYKVGTSEKTYSELHYNEIFKHDTYYSFDISQYLVDEYMDRGDPKYSLLLSLPQKTINENVTQLIFGDQNHPTNDLTMKVYISTYNITE